YNNERREQAKKRRKEVSDIRRDNFAEDDVWVEDFFAEDICDIFAEDVFSEDIFAESNEFDEESGKELDKEAIMAPTII
ncbi:9517_t:CDS:1, partial [Racocetra persica]